MNQSNLNLEVQNSTTNSRYLKVTVTNFPALRIYKKIKSSKLNNLLKLEITKCVDLFNPQIQTHIFFININQYF